MGHLREEGAPGAVHEQEMAIPLKLCLGVATFGKLHET